MRLANFRVIGDNLKDRFDGASRVMMSNSVRASGSANAVGGVSSSPNAVGVVSNGLSPNAASPNVYDEERMLNDEHVVKHHPNMPSPNSLPNQNGVSRNSVRGRQGRQGRKNNR